MLQAVIFDSDGVLLKNSEYLFHLSCNLAMAPYGIFFERDDYKKRWITADGEYPNMEGVVRDYNLAERGVTAHQLVRERNAILQELISAGLLDLMPHAWKTVKWLSGKYPLALVTSDSERNTCNKLGDSGLLDMFQVRVTYEDTERHKPHPEPYQLAVERLDVKPCSTLVVEDNPSGVKSAKAVKPKGCKVIAYPNGYTLGMEFPGADRLVRSLAEIDEGMLGELFTQ